jgi:hypothetical protein
VLREIGNLDPLNYTYIHKYAMILAEQGKIKEAQEV